MALSGLTSSRVSVDLSVARLMRMVAALEETIIRLEHLGSDSPDTVRRLRIVQGEILAALHLLEGDFPISG